MRGAPLVVACAGCLLAGCTPAPIEIVQVDPGALTDGLIAHWPLDEGTGGTAGDTSGNGHNGLLQGPGIAWMAKGKFNAAVHFSGTDLISVAPFPPAPPSFTVSAWVYIASADFGPPISNLVSTEVLGGGWALFASLDTVPGSGPGTGPPSYEFEYAVPPTPANPTGFITAQSIPVQPDAWVHLAAVLDGSLGTLTLYTSVAPPMSVPATTPMLPGSTMLEIGHSTRQEPGGAFPVTGAIDDVAIYNRALSPVEIGALGVAAVPNPN
jgi:hypothetical protein